MRLESVQKKHLAQLEAINVKLPQVKRDLAASDLVLPQHEIQVEPEDIAPVVPHERRALFRYGQMTRAIIRVLREQNGWITSRELTTRLGAHIDGFEFIDPVHTLEAIRRRLNQLAKKGLVERECLALGKIRTGRHNRWRLVQPR